MCHTQAHAPDVHLGGSQAAEQHHDIVRGGRPGEQGGDGPAAQGGLEGVVGAALDGGLELCAATRSGAGIGLLCLQPQLRCQLAREAVGSNQVSP